MKHDRFQHNITTLAEQIYDKLANNTDNDMFDVNDIDLVDMSVDYSSGVIHIEYHQKKFDVVIRESY